VVAGGFNQTIRDTAELSDPATGKFSSIGSMTTPRNNRSAVALFTAYLLSTRNPWKWASLTRVTSLEVIARPA
jgi:hypothetical protein